MRRELTPVISTMDAPVGRNPSGIVPARPDSRLPTPSAATAPCTERKSTARLSGQDTRWIATAPPMVCIVQTRATNTNAGSRAQKSGVKRRSRAAHAGLGVPIQGARETRSKSYRPNVPATVDPATIPMIGAHSRARPFAVSVMPTMTTRVVNALSGAPSGGVPLGTLFSWSNMIGMTVTGVSISTVPVTVGVRMRRNSDRRAANANWTRARMTTRVPSNAGPPVARAAMLTAMAAPDVPIARM